MKRALVAEDSAAIRELLELMLTRLGFEVVAAADGLEALELADGSAALDIVVTDVEMPGMDGVTLAAELEKRFPGLRVLFVTGGPDRGPLGPVLKKPFTVDDFEAAVRELEVGPG